MADKFDKSNSKYDALHLKRMAAVERKIKLIYRKAADEAALLGAGIKPKSTKPFSLDDYPEAKKKAEQLIQELRQGINVTIIDGVQAEWTLANNKNNALSSLVFGDSVGKLTEEQYRRYYSTNHEALQAFMARKTAGLQLSDKVWKYTDGFKNEIEMALDLGIRSGKSAAEMSRDVRSYLQYPDKLFRRVRDEHGQLHLSKAAAAFHPGLGVYRSSYMNARRLAATETNIAYRTADHLRHQQMDFVVGIKICLSNNHNCKGVPTGMFFDICDELQGNYPKDFKFTGWHPHCRCHVETILKTPAELQLDTERILAGRPTAIYSRNAVKEIPANFKNWVRDNKDRILDAEGTRRMPYFLRDNAAIYGKILGAKTPKEIAAIRHYNRTKDDEQAIRDAWNARYQQQATQQQVEGINVNIATRATARHAARTQQEIESITKAWDVRRIAAIDNQWMAKGINRKNAGFELLNEARTALWDNYDHTKVQGLIDQSVHKLKVLQNALVRQAARTADEIRRIQDLADTRKYGKAYVDRIHEMESKLGIKRGRRMSVEQADMQNANPNWQPSLERHRNKSGKIVYEKNPKYNEGYAINCQTCAPAYALRLLGFDVKAGCNTAGSLLEDLSKQKSLHAWKDITGKKAPYTDLYKWMSDKAYTEMNADRYVEFWQDSTKETGVYIITINWQGGGAHTTILQRFKDGTLKYIEPQHNNLSESRTKKSAAKTLLAMAADGAKHPEGTRGIIRVDDKFFNLEDWGEIFVK